jgi:hypothetical protein
VFYCALSTLHAKYNYKNQVEQDEINGSCSTNGEKRNAYRLLVRKLVGKRPLGRPRRRWVDNIKMDLGEVVCGLVVRILDYRSRGLGSIPGTTRLSEK